MCRPGPLGAHSLLEEAGRLSSEGIPRVLKPLWRTVRGIIGQAADLGAFLGEVAFSHSVFPEDLLYILSRELGPRNRKPIKTWPRHIPSPLGGIKR